MESSQKNLYVDIPDRQLSKPYPPLTPSQFTWKIFSNTADIAWPHCNKNTFVLRDLSLNVISDVPQGMFSSLTQLSSL